MKNCKLPPNNKIDLRKQTFDKIYMHIYCPPLDTVTVSRPMWLLYILFIVIAYKMSFYDNPPIDLFTLPPDVVHSSHFLRSIS